MSIHRLFKRQFPLRNWVSGVVFLCFILLLSGCGGEESGDNPVVETTNGVTPNEAIPLSTNYFPMTIGNRWVYRNPDGSEWTREITNAKVIGELRYHVSSHNPPNHARLDFLKNPAHAATLHRLVLLVKNDGVRDAVRQTILRSGGEHPDWDLSHTFDGSTWRTQKSQSALVYLFHYRTSVVSHSELALLRFSLIPGQTYNVLNMNLSGSNETASEFHTFEASGVISGEVGYPESVHTPAGMFEDCLKIEYRPDVPAFDTTGFRNLVPRTPRKVIESYLSHLESGIQGELANLMISMMRELGLESVWLAPGVGPIKIETQNGIAELIDYEIKAVASGQ